ncbi:MAG: hypothetical protein HYS23_02215 [Geobacter sp.]|nr:hypothetical protein [Geobacter sp.]
MYLKKIGGTFYYYCRVPKDLTGLLMRKEPKKSLKTTACRTAKTAAKTYALELERLCVYVRTGIMDDAAAKMANHRPSCVGFHCKTNWYVSISVVGKCNGGEFKALS